MHTVEITVLKSLVQCPPPGPFSIDSTVWAKGSRGTAAIYSAVIPSNRLKDFRPDLGAELDSNWTVFRTRPRKVSQQCITRDTSRKDITYHCRFGPKDHRRGGSNVETERPPKKAGSRRSKSAAGNGIKRGRTAKFTVSELALDQTLVKLSYTSLKHVDQSGLACHGPQDSTALPIHQTAARLSSQMKDHITSAVNMGKCSRQSSR